MPHVACYQITGMFGVTLFLHCVLEITGASSIIIEHFSCFLLQ